MLVLSHHSNDNATNAKDTTMSIEVHTHPEFSKLFANDTCIAAIYRQTDGLWQMRDRRIGETTIGTFEKAANWLTALSIAAALS